MIRVKIVGVFYLFGVVLGKSQPKCDWVDTLLISGDNKNYQDFYLTCTNGFLESITNVDAGSHQMVLKSNDNDSSKNDVYCDWIGPGRINGIYDCDDFNFECYDNVLYGMKTVESQAQCPSLDFAPFSSNLNGVVCNFATAIRTSGTNYVNFAMDCQNGTIDALYYDESSTSTSSPSFLRGLKKMNEIEDEDLNLNKNHNKKKIKTDSSPTCSTWATADGSWELLHQHNQDFTYEYTYGTSSSDTTSTSSEWSASLEQSFEAGIIFAHYSVSENISYSIAQSVSSSTTITYTETTTVPCSSPNGLNEGGALFQWVMNTQHVDETTTTTTVFSDTTLCIEYEQTPLCPLNACLDENCQTCDSNWISDSNLTNTTGGFLIGTCNWGSSVLITGQHLNGFTFDCISNKMDGISGSGDYTSSSSSSLSTTASSPSSLSDNEDTVTTCSSCDWEGPKSFAGPNDCDDSIIECYDGFIYDVTFVGDIGRFKASQCRDLLKPNDIPLSGTLCNWNDDNDYIMQDIYSNSNIHMSCNNGVIPTYQFLT
mmetsp:Transcript_9248/g.12117  ORF Transcript_9248/g.12117 Transcript_9248/m.12117 type:complete len:540 (-) Transcript_9248:122-1741(-)